MNSLQIIPVIDILNGVVVRGVGGRRDEYRPIESVLVQSAKPLDVAIAFREKLGMTTLYVADLDGIVRREPNLQTLHELCSVGFEVWIDAGVRSLGEAAKLLDAGAAKIIAGLESTSGPMFLSTLIRELGTERVVFSLDLKAGCPMTASMADWPDDSTIGIARSAIQAGVTQMIVLDLVSVGEQRGPSTLDLCDEIRRLLPQITLITGGGVRGPDDLDLLRSREIDGVLVATALHNGSLYRELFVENHE